jgi:hypothetical protein
MLDFLQHFFFAFKVHQKQIFSNSLALKNLFPTYVCLKQALIGKSLYNGTTKVDPMLRGSLVMVRPRVADGEDGLHIWRIAANTY